MRRIACLLAAGLSAMGAASLAVQSPKKPAPPKPPQKQPQPPPSAAKTLPCPICRTMEMTREKTAKTPRAFTVGGQTWYCCDNDKCAKGMAALDQYLKNKKRKP